MTAQNWGLLPKSQIDDETIEEAIARLLLAHEADETSHLGLGESLQSHKASEIIDHLAESIVEDKIAYLQITPRLLNTNSMFSQVQLESIDAWGKIQTGTGNAITLESLGVVALKPGTEIGSLAILNCFNPLIPSDATKNPFLQIFVSDGGDEVSDIAVSLARENPFASDGGGFGIEYVQADDKIYGFYDTFYDEEFHRERVELFAGAPYKQIWRAELYRTEEVIKFYINNILIETMDISDFIYDFESDWFLAFGAQKQVNYAGAAVFFMNPIFNQDI